MKNTRLVNPLKFVRFIAILIVIIILIPSFVISLGDSDTPYSEYVVRNGDTLWDIAKEVRQTKYEGEGDIRYIIYYIKEFNKIENGNIYPGDVIKIPEKL
jgi:hypothetical protein